MDIPEDLPLCEGVSPSFKNEVLDVFASLHSQLIEEYDGPSSPSSLLPDLRFLLGDAKVEAHTSVMSIFCEGMRHPTTFIKEEGGQFFLVVVPEELGVTLEAFKVFRKAIYLQELPPTTFDLWLQVRRLADHFGCEMILKKCDEVRMTLSNCHIVWEKWPEGTGVKDRALDLIKENLVSLIGTESCWVWTQSLWEAILCLNDIPSLSCPSEDTLFSALLKWKDKKSMDDGTFRSVFKGLVRFPLMTDEGLLSKTVRQSGMLQDGEVMRIYDEKHGEGQTDFNKTSRSETPGPRLPLSQANHSSVDGVFRRSTRSTKSSRGKDKDPGGGSNKTPAKAPHPKPAKDNRIPSSSSSVTVEVARKRYLNGNRALKHVPNDYLPRFLELLNAGCPPPIDLYHISKRRRMDGGGGRVWPKVLDRMANRDFTWEDGGRTAGGAKGDKKSCGWGKCRKSFPSLAERIEHERLAHKGLTSLKCYFCAKLFQRNSKLEEHLRFHTLEHPFPCPRSCGYEAKRAWHLKSHLKTCVGVRHIRNR